MAFWQRGIRTNIKERKFQEGKIRLNIKKQFTKTRNHLTV